MVHDVALEGSAALGLVFYILRHVLRRVGVLLKSC